MDAKDGLGKETVFDFKYIPSLKGKTREGQRKVYFFKRPGIEILSYMGLVAALTTAMGVSSAAYLVILRAFPNAPALVASNFGPALRKSLTFAKEMAQRVKM